MYVIMGLDLENDAYSTPQEAPTREIICEYQTPDGKCCSLETAGRLRVLCPIRSLTDAISELKCPEYEPTTTEQKS